MTSDAVRFCSIAQGLCGGADFDPTRTYRYRLWRKWGPEKHVCWVMLNPSTADETRLDPTLRRCATYSKLWGYDGLEVVNLYGFRSPNPKDLWKVIDPVGPENDRFIRDAAAGAALVIVGWGTKAKPDRVREVALLLPGDVRCLKVTAGGHPNHPLYLAKTLMPVPWPTTR